MSDMCKSANRNCLEIKLNSQSFEIVKKFCQLDDTTGARYVVAGSIITMIRRGWSKLKDLVPLLASRGLPLGRLYFACALIVILYGSETLPLKEKGGMTLERSDARMIRLICTVRPKDKISAKALRTRLKLNSVGKPLQNRRPQRFGHLERLEENLSSNKCRIFKVSVSFSIGQRRKTCSDIIKSYLFFSIWVFFD